MKKFILTSLAMMIAVFSFGQKKGEATFEGTIGLSIIPSTTNYYYQGSITESGVQSFNFGMNIDLGGGYFFADNWKVAGTIGFKLVNNSTTLFTIKPYVGYYLPIITDFYYVPKVQLGVGFGNVITNNIKYSCTDFIAGVSFLSFEYRISSHVGIGISAGNIGYKGTTLKSENLKNVTNSFVFDINTANITFVYYM